LQAQIQNYILQEHPYASCNEINTNVLLGHLQ